ncbi:MAG: hypothetical protein QGF67_01815 [Lentisphaeria bacterium]|jgi:hypothetical protein|nr:hypothetical protein [Lentisphaeria bacterium]MDP7740149.1 hypothetical protein [Lentisphaeria bacterium]
MNDALAIEIGGLLLMAGKCRTRLGTAVQPLTFPPRAADETVVPSGSTRPGLSGKVG